MLWVIFVLRSCSRYLELCFPLAHLPGGPRCPPQVNTQLYSLKEKQQLADLISTMLAYNLTYHQERLPEGQYVYKLDP